MALSDILGAIAGPVGLASNLLLPGAGPFVGAGLGLASELTKNKPKQPQIQTPGAVTQGVVQQPQISGTLPVISAVAGLLPTALQWAGVGGQSNNSPNLNLTHLLQKHQTENSPIAKGLFGIMSGNNLYNQIT